MAGVAYLSIRAVYFPYVMFKHAVPDMWEVGGMPAAGRNGVSAGAVYSVMAFGILFSLLQM